MKCLSALAIIRIILRRKGIFAPENAPLRLKKDASFKLLLITLNQLAWSDPREQLPIVNL